MAALTQHYGMTWTEARGLKVWEYELLCDYILEQQREEETPPGMTRLA